MSYVVRIWPEVPSVEGVQENGVLCSAICMKIWLIWGIQTAVFEVLRRHLTGRTKENHSISLTTAGLRSEMRDKERASRLRRRSAGSQSASSRGCAMLSILVKHRLFFLLSYSVFNTPLLCLWSYMGNKLAISIYICPPLLHLLTCVFHSSTTTGLSTLNSVRLQMFVLRPVSIKPVTLHTNYSWPHFTFPLCNPPTPNFSTSLHFNTGTVFTLHSSNSHFPQFPSPSSWGLFHKTIFPKKIPYNERANLWT
jgi:hypothetical protein